MTLRDQVRAAIEAAMERNDEPDRDDVDVAADAVMGLIAPIKGVLGAAMRIAGPEFRATGGGHAKSVCPLCGAWDWVTDRIDHRPGCAYPKLRDILDSFG